MIAPFTSLHGETRIGGGSTIGPGSHADRRAGRRRGQDRALLRRGRRRSATGSASARSPTCVPGTVLREGSKAGTFVEIKNSDVGAGHEDPASLLHRRCGHRRGHESRREHDHRQLRRLPQAPHDDRLERVKTSVDTTLVAPVDGRRRRLSRRAGSVITQGRAAGRARRSPRARQTQRRGLRRAPGRAGAQAKERPRAAAESTRRRSRPVAASIVLGA